MIRQLSFLFLGVTFGLAANAEGQNASAQTGGQASVQTGTQSTQISGQASASSSASANAGLTSGTAFNSSLTKPVDAKKAKAGDTVEARTTENVKASGKTVLPKGTRLLGHVTQASARAKGDSQSTVGIVFDRALLKDGTEVPLNVGIQAIASSETMTATSESELGSTAMGSAGANASGSTRGALGGIASSAGGAVGGAGATTGSVVNTAGREVNGAASTTASAAGTARGTAGGLNGAGQLTSNSRGVFGLNGLNLNAAGTSTTQGSVISSADKNIHLATGTRMLLATQAGTTSSNQ